MPHPTWMGHADWFRKYPYDERASKAQDQALLYRTYRTSCFAGLPDVLLGYKYAGLSVRKTLTGRYHYLRSMSASRGARHRLFGTFSHTVAAVRDLLGLIFGMELRVMKGRVQAADAGVLAMWDAIRLRLLSLDATRENQ
jgi:hypothetical protein